MLQPLSPNRLLIFFLLLWVVLVGLFLLPNDGHRGSTPLAGTVLILGVITIVFFWLLWRIFRRRA